MSESEADSTALAVAGPPPEEAVADTRLAQPKGLRAFLSITEGAIGAALLAAMLLLVLVGPYLAPFSPDEVAVAAPAEHPSSAHLLGTDLLGRDVLSRFLSGGRSVLLLPLVSVGIAIVLACIIGLVSGYLGGLVDTVTTRVLDVLLAIPSFLLVLVIIAGFGTGNVVVVLAVALVYTPSIARVLRGATQAVRPREFVLAARARGDSIWWIAFREILPNISATLLVEVALRLTFAIMFIASLSFLGLGVQPPSSNWGVLVGENRGLLYQQPWACVVPALGIGLLAIAVNLISDALSQYFGDESSSEVVL
jgi:peptide/nickel transport system permease protein